MKHWFGDDVVKGLMMNIDFNTGLVLNCRKILKKENIQNLYY